MVNKSQLSLISEARVSNIDILRAIAALAVSFYHFNRESLTGGTLYAACSHFGNYGVDIFFVVSGYVIPLSLLKSGFTLSRLSIFLKARFFRLYPAYILAAVLTIGLWYASTWIPGFRGAMPPALSVLEIFANITLTCDLLHQSWFGVVFWTLAIEAQYYVLVALSFGMVFAPQGRQHLLRYGTLFAWLLMPLIFRQGPTIFGWTAIFAMGFLAILWQGRFLRNWECCVGMVLACWVMWEVRGAASAIVGLATTIAILFLPKIDWKPLVWVGTVSYSLYLLHVPIGGRVLNVLERFSHFELVKILAVPAALATSLLAAWLFFLLIEKPSHEAARKITKNKVPKNPAT
jgi:peptidoglycan/LPS O-acetylase OafA/YrhL